RSAPSDGETRFTSMMKRAPRPAKACARLRRVGSARARRLSSETPSSRAATSSRLRATISPSTPPISRMGRLHERVEPLARSPGGNRLERDVGAFREAPCKAGGLEEGARIERDDLRLGGRRLAAQQRIEARRILGGRSTL